MGASQLHRNYVGKHLPICRTQNNVNRFVNGSFPGILDYGIQNALHQYTFQRQYGDPTSRHLSVKIGFTDHSPVRI